MDETRDWANDSEELLATLAGLGCEPRARSMVVARYPYHRRVIWFAGLRTPIDASEEALDRLVTDGYLVWDESPRPLRRLRITAAGLAHAQAVRHAQPAGPD